MSPSIESTSKSRILEFRNNVGEIKVKSGPDDSDQLTNPSGGAKEYPDFIQKSLTWKKCKKAVTLSPNASHRKRNHCTGTVMCKSNKTRRIDETDLTDKSTEQKSCQSKKVKSIIRSKNKTKRRHSVSNEKCNTYTSTSDYQMVTSHLTTIKSEKDELTLQCATDSKDEADLNTKMSYLSTEERELVNLDSESELDEGELLSETEGDLTSNVQFINLKSDTIFHDYDFSEKSDVHSSNCVVETLLLVDSCINESDKIKPCDGVDNRPNVTFTSSHVIDETSSASLKGSFLAPSEPPIVSNNICTDTLSLDSNKARSEMSQSCIIDKNNSNDGKVLIANLATCKSNPNLCSSEISNNETYSSTRSELVHNFVSVDSYLDSDDNVSCDNEIDPLACTDFVVEKSTNSSSCNCTGSSTICNVCQEDIASPNIRTVDKQECVRVAEITEHTRDTPPCHGRYVLTDTSCDTGERDSHVCGSITEELGGLWVHNYKLTKDGTNFYNTSQIVPDLNPKIHNLQKTSLHSPVNASSISKSIKLVKKFYNKRNYLAIDVNEYSEQIISEKLETDVNHFYLRYKNGVLMKTAKPTRTFTVFSRMMIVNGGTRSNNDRPCESGDTSASNSVILPGSRKDSIIIHNPVKELKEFLVSNKRLIMVHNAMSAVRKKELQCLSTKQPEYHNLKHKRMHLQVHFHKVLTHLKLTWFKEKLLLSKINAIF